MAQAEIKAVITAKDEASSVVQGFGNSVGGMGKAAAIGIGIASAAVVAFGALAVHEFSASEDSVTQLNSVLKSTGGIAGVTADQALKLASSLQSVTKFSDETILDGENLLLTFTGIGKDVFPRATEAMLDMSQALKQDVHASAIQLGKALQAPTLGMAALSKTGALNKDDMERLAKQWEQRNTPLAQQQVELLQALEKEFKGSARAAGTTLSGQLEILKNSFSDVLEVIGGGIAAVIKPAISAFNSWFAAMGGAEGILDSIRKSWEMVIQGFTTGGDIFNQGENSNFNMFLLAIHDTLVQLGNAFNTYVKPALLDLWNTIQVQLLPTLLDFWDKNKNWIIPALKDFAILIVGTIIVSILAFIETLKIIIQIVSGVVSAITYAGEMFKNVFAAVANGATYLRDHFWEVMGNIQGFFATLPARLLFYAMLAIGGIINYLQHVDWWGVLVRLLQAFSTLGNSINSVMGQLLQSLIHLDWGAIGRAAANALIGNIEGVINGAIGGIPGAPHIHIPRFASGVENFGGGLAIVGERGPELLNLPRGSSILPNDKMGSSTNQNTTVNINVGLMTGSAIEQREAAMKIFEHLKDIASSKGQTFSQMIGSA